MANPVINPAVWDAVGPYTVSNSDYFAADIALTSIDDSAVELVLTIPAGGSVRLVRNPVGWADAGTPILSAGAWIANPPALADWMVAVAAGGSVTAPATVSISSNVSNAGGVLRIVVTGIGVQPASIEGSAGTFSIDRVLAAPSLSSVGVTTGTVRERREVTLSMAATATRVQNPAAVPPLAAEPATVKKWTEDPANPLALTDFTSLGNTATFTAPGVYQPETLNFTASATLDINGNGIIDVGEATTSQLLSVPVEVVRYGLALIVDRSGSMTGTLGSGLTKWQAAVQAAHGWTDLFRAFRPQANHLAGVMTFESGGGWTANPLPVDDITFRNPANGSPVPGLTALSSLGDVNDWNLGSEMTNTPIGDALVETWQAIGTTLGANDAGAVILLTDGEENAGTVAIGNSAPPTRPKFALRRTQPDLNTANELIGPRVYTIGVGLSVDEDVLNLLGNSYRLITNSVAEMKPAFAAMLGLVVDAQELMATPPMSADPDNPANALYFPVSTKEQVLVFMVHWSAITDDLRLARRAQGGGGTFTVVGPADPGVTVTKRGTHALIRVDLRLHFPGIASPATEWRLQHVDSGNVPRPLPVSNALAMVDLVTKAEVSFDRKQYFVGEPIKLICRIRSGGIAISDATVIVDGARPGEGLGTFLTQHAKRQGTPRPLPGKNGDPPTGKSLMYRSLLAALDMQDLPIVAAPDFELYDDGAHDDGEAGNGDFANIYADTDKEGTYTFRFRIEGRLPDGSRFSRIFVKSTWVGIRPDPDLLGVVWTNAGISGNNVVSLATMTPQTRGGEFLGPYRTAAIELVVHGGTLDGDLIDNHDGSYSQKVVHRRDVDPVLSTTIYGTPMAPAGPAFDPPGSPRDCCRLWHRAFRCTIAGIKRLFTGN